MLFVYFSIYPNLSRVELAVNFDFNLIVNKDFKEFEKSCFSRNWSKVDLFIEKRDFCDLWQLLFLSTRKFRLVFDKRENKNISILWLVD